ncbi:MAG: hypothetical protein ACJATK_002838 [Paracoccaceae bacterium]|jgi:hypothetical protein
MSLSVDERAKLIKVNLEGDKIYLKKGRSLIKSFSLIRILSTKTTGFTGDPIGFGKQFEWSFHRCVF